MIIKIQKAFRGYLGRKRVAEIRATKRSGMFGMSVGDVVKLTNADIDVRVEC